MKSYTQAKLPGWSDEGGVPFRSRGLSWQRMVRLRGRAMLAVFVVAAVAAAGSAVWRTPAEYQASAPVELLAPGHVSWQQAVERFATGLWVIERGTVRKYVDLEDLRRAR